MISDGKITPAPGTNQIAIKMNRSAQRHRFSFFQAICSQIPVTRIPDNSKLFRFPLKVRVIGI